MIDWSRVALYGTLLLGCVIRIVMRRKMKREQEAEAARYGTAADEIVSPIWSEVLFIGMILLTIIFEFLPVTTLVRQIIAAITLVVVIVCLLAHIKAIPRSPKNVDDNGRR